MISQLSGAVDTSNADDDGHEDEAASSWCMFIVMVMSWSWLSLSLEMGLPVRRVMILISKDCLSVAFVNDFNRLPVRRLDSIPWKGVHCKYLAK